MEQRLTIIGLGMADLERSTKFYEHCFGWKRYKSSNDHIRFYKLNGIMISLYGRAALAKDAGIPSEGEGFHGFSLTYNTRKKEEVDFIFRELKEKEVRIIKEPEEVFWGCYSGYVSDPDGHFWEIAFNPYLPLDSTGAV